MCGRFAEPLDLSKKFQMIIDDEIIPEYDPRYNVTPGQYTSIITSDRQLISMRWGLVPAWLKKPDKSFLMINLRDDTILFKKKFKANYNKMRCLVPVAGFYEWARESKEPYYFFNDSDLALAGVWDCWTRGDLVLNSFTIITTDANEVVNPVHHRMPVIISPEHYDRWLSTDRVDDLLQPAPPDFLKKYRVSTYVNKPGNEGPECIQPLITTS